MSWRNRLAGMQSNSGQESPDEALTKPTKGAFGSFGSDPDGHSAANDPAVRDETRAHLLALADGEGVDAAHVHRLHTDDVAACEGLPDETLVAYLRALDRGAVMDARIVVPDGYTQAAHCNACGPVWLWPGVPDRLIACPWCFRRKAGKSFPRPRKTCGDCRHYSPDQLNPLAGVGGCALGAGRARWPMTHHHCAEHDPLGVSARFAQAPARANDLAEEPPFARDTPAYARANELAGEQPSPGLPLGIAHANEMGGGP